MKKLVVIAAFLAAAFGASAQFKVGANIGLQVPTGDYGDVLKAGFGGSIGGKYLFTDNIGAGLNVGYYSFGYDFPGIDESMYMVPIALNGSYYFMTDNFRPYAGLDLGAYILGSTFEGSDSETEFGLAPVVGMQYYFNDSFGLNANLKYNTLFNGGDGVDNFGTFGINVGVVYTFGQ